MTDEQKTKRYKSAFTKLGVEYPFEFKDETKLSAEERMIYQWKLRDYRDLFSVMETKFNEGKEEGKVEGKEEGKIEMIENMIFDGFDDEIIVRISKKPIEFVQRIRKEMTL